MKQKQKAFTLTELLVVVVIIGILAAVVLPKFTRMLEGFKTAEAEHILEAVRNEQEARCTLGKKYTRNTDDLAVWAKSDSKHFDYTLEAEGMTAQRRGEAYSLSIPSYEDGRICCENCEGLNRNYISCTELQAKEDYVSGNSCAADCVQTAQPPAAPCGCTGHIESTWNEGACRWDKRCVGDDPSQCTQTPQPPDVSCGCVGHQEYIWNEGSHTWELGEECIGDDPSQCESEEKVSCEAWEEYWFNEKNCMECDLATVCGSGKPNYDAFVSSLEASQSEAKQACCGKCEKGTHITEFGICCPYGQVAYVDPQTNEFACGPCAQAVGPNYVYDMQTNACVRKFSGSRQGFGILVEDPDTVYGPGFSIEGNMCGHYFVGKTQVQKCTYYGYSDEDSFCDEHCDASESECTAACYSEDSWREQRQIALQIANNNFEKEFTVANGRFSYSCSAGVQAGKSTYSWDGYMFMQFGNGGRAYETNSYSSYKMCGDINLDCQDGSGLDDTYNPEWWREGLQNTDISYSSSDPYNDQAILQFVQNHPNMEVVLHTNGGTYSRDADGNVTVPTSDGTITIGADGTVTVTNSAGLSITSSDGRTYTITDGTNSMTFSEIDKGWNVPTYGGSDGSIWVKDENGNLISSEDYFSIIEDGTTEDPSYWQTASMWLVWDPPYNSGGSSVTDPYYLVPIGENPATSGVLMSDSLRLGGGYCSKCDGGRPDREAASRIVKESGQIVLEPLDLIRDSSTGNLMLRSQGGNSPCKGDVSSGFGVTMCVTPKMLPVQGYQCKRRI